MLAESAVVATQVVMDANTTTTILGNLNTLYSNAVSQLISYTVGLVALVGIVIPAITSIIQQRSLKNEKKSLEITISDEIGKAKDNMRKDLLAEMSQLIEAQEKRLSSKLESRFNELEKQIQRTEAGIFFVQANTLMDNETYALAVAGYCAAIEGFFNSNDELNGQRALKRLINDCLPKINKPQFEGLEVDEKLQDLKKFLAEKDENGRFSDSITYINNEVKKILVREPKPD